MAKTTKKPAAKAVKPKAKAASAKRKPAARTAAVPAVSKPSTARPGARRSQHTVEVYNLRVQVLTTVFTTLCVIFAVIAAVQYH